MTLSCRRRALTERTTRCVLRMSRELARVTYHLRWVCPCRIQLCYGTGDHRPALPRSTTIGWGSARGERSVAGRARRRASRGEGRRRAGRPRGQGGRVGLKARVLRSRTSCRRQGGRGRDREARADSEYGIAERDDVELQTLSSHRAHNALCAAGRPPSWPESHTAFAGYVRAVAL